MKLIIVESPNKKTTIAKLLNSKYIKENNDSDTNSIPDDKYVVAASVGHIRDIAISGKYMLGVNIDSGNFEVDYEILKGKEKTVEGLKTLVSKADDVYLATDPDREGEAISWHLANVLGLDIEKVKRVAFHEITPRGIKDAFRDVSNIDMSMVRSQEARRVLDRIIGFRLSYLVKTKLNSQSAGRVQSAVLKLICDRENEINDFIKEEYYNIFIDVNNNDDVLTLKLQDENIKTIDDAKNVLDSIGDDVNFEGIEENFKTVYAFPPFTTSTLQQEAFHKFGYDGKKTMSIAQKLFEGIKLENSVQGLITYMRTDSIRLSPIFIASAKKYIKDEFGEQYVGKAYVQKSKNGVQDAHEAIRPTDVKLTPDSIKEYLTKEQYNLYDLIYTRAISSIMANKEVINQVYSVSKNGHIFKCEKQKLVFDGFSKYYGKYENKHDYIELKAPNNNLLPIINKKQEQEFTKPKPRYNAGSIVKLMEDSGIGRPSTYGSTIDTLKKRRYINSFKGVISPTPKGLETTKMLEEYFKELVDIEYTSNMEKALDEIQNYPVNDIDDREKEIAVLRFMNNDFEKSFKYALDNIENAKPKETGELCPICGRPMIYKTGRFGEFEACSGYPECKYIKNETEETDIVCPECKKGHLVVRKGRYGKFLACSEFPKCNYKEPYKKDKKKEG